MSCPIGVPKDHASPKSRILFLAKMPELYAMIVFYIGWVIAYMSYSKYNLPIPIALTIGILGCLLTRHLGKGGKSLIVPEHASFSDKRPVAIVTGASSGIGAGTAKSLAQLGVHVIMACRDVEKGKLVMESIIKELNIKPSQLQVMKYDNNDLHSVVKFVEEFRGLNLPLNYLANNAGAMVVKYKEIDQVTPSVSAPFTTNHLGHFLLTLSLLDLIIRDKTRIVNVSSAIAMAANDGMTVKECYHPDPSSFDPPTFYKRTKMCNLWFTTALQKRLDLIQLENNTISLDLVIRDEITHASVVSVHPGTVYSSFHMPLYREHWGGALIFFPIMMFPMAFCAMKTLEEGARSTVHGLLAKSPLFTPFLTKENKSHLNDPQSTPYPGQLIAECKISPINPLASDVQKSEELWHTSLEMVKPFLKLNQYNEIINKKMN